MNGVPMVVTGLDSGGKSVVTRDSETPLIRASDTLGAWTVDLWEMLAVPSTLSDEDTLATGCGFPQAGALVFRIVQPPPESVVLLDPEEAKNYYGRKALIDLNEFGMHHSDTVDMIVILSGEVWMKLKYPDEVHLKAGDTLIQRRTVHT